MNRSIFLVLLPWSVALLPACGGTATTNSGQTNGDGDGIRGDGDSEDGDNTGDGDAVEDRDGDSCNGFDDDAPGHLDILIRNERSETIYLGPREPTCGTLPLFSVSNAQGEELSAHAGPCATSCENLVDGLVLGCGAICLYPEVKSIEPGEALSVAWDTRMFLPASPPQECLESASAGVTCLQAQRIEPGTFVFGASAGTEWICDPGIFPDCYDPLVGGETLTAETVVQLDASYGIDEKSDGSNADPAPGAILGVEIVFK